jgi:hypothetical protein
MLQVRRAQATKQPVPIFGGKETIMPTKSNSRKNQNTAQHESTAAETARKSYQETVRTGSRIQEEAGQWWTKMLSQTAAWADWQKQFSSLTALTANTFQINQRRLEDVMAWIEKNSRTNAELVKKAADAAQTPAIAESQTKWLDFWTASLRATQANVEAATQMTTRAIDSWAELIRKNGELAEFRTVRAA